MLIPLEEGREKYIYDSGSNPLVKQRKDGVSKKGQGFTRRPHLVVARLAAAPMEHLLFDRRPCGRARGGPLNLEVASHGCPGHTVLYVKRVDKNIQQCFLQSAGMNRT